MTEVPGPANPTGRLSWRDTVLPERLRAALARLNPALPVAALQQTEAQLTLDRGAMLPVAANRELWRLLRDGVAVELRQTDGSLKPDRVRVIDWVKPDTNDFFVASQIWVASTLYKRRPVAIGFVNGLPLLLCEWKAPGQSVQEASDSARTYFEGAPHGALFVGFTRDNALQAVSPDPPRSQILE